MDQGQIGRIGALLLVASMASVACSSSGSGGTGATGGSHSTGGSSSTGGGAGGSTGGSGSGTGGSGGGAAVTTLDGSKAVNALSSTQASQLCDDTYNYFAAKIPAATTCKWAGLAYGLQSSAQSDTVLQNQCSTHQASCMQTANPWTNNPGCNDLPTTCTATVAQYSACIADEVSSFVQVVGTLPACTSFTMSQTGQVVDAQTANPPASCMSLMNTCPDLYPPSPLNFM